jgi:hypothetical protein
VEIFSRFFDVKKKFIADHACCALTGHGLMQVKKVLKVMCSETEVAQIDLKVGYCDDNTPLPALTRGHSSRGRICNVSLRFRMRFMMTKHFVVVKLRPERSWGLHSNTH